MGKLAGRKVWAVLTNRGACSIIGGDNENQYDTRSAENQSFNGKPKATVVRNQTVYNDAVAFGLPLNDSNATSGEQNTTQSCSIDLDYYY